MMYGETFYGRHTKLLAGLNRFYMKYSSRTIKEDLRHIHVLTVIHMNEMNVFDQ